jgi:hypothetical protein
MNLLTRRVPWATWQFGLLKLAMLALGIILGALFAESWRPWLWPIGLLFLVTAVWVTVLWPGALRRAA